MNITPISDVVVIRRQEQSTVSGGGIFLPHADELREDIGTVMFVGRGKPHKCKKCAGTTHIPMQVRVGDRVIFSTNGHQITKVNGEELIVLRQDSIIAVIEDETEVSSSRGIQQVQQFFVSGEK
jgi:chaperonin GroES